MDCINNVFGIEVNDSTQKALYSIQPVSLPSIFNVYLNRAERKDDKPTEKVTETKKSEPIVEEPKDITDEDRKQAEEKKQLGNKLVGEKDYQGAIKAYSEAIDLDGEKAVYYANRYVLFNMG